MLVVLNIATTERAAAARCRCGQRRCTRHVVARHHVHARVRAECMHANVPTARRSALAGRHCVLRAHLSLAYGGGSRTEASPGPRDGRSLIQLLGLG